MQWALERVAMHDPPFGSIIKNGMLCFGDNCQPLNDVDKIIALIRENVPVPPPVKTWKELRSTISKQAFIENHLKCVFGNNADIITQQMTFAVWLCISLKLINLNETQLNNYPSLRFSDEACQEINELIESFFQD